MIKYTLSFIFVLATYCVQGQQYPDRHNTTLQNTWISCTPAPNPAKPGTTSHWIQYDFGTTYALHKSKVWNVNAYEHSDNGIKDVQIYYSIDGVTWKDWGRYYLDQATETSTYQGEQGPNFDGLIARYLIIEGTSNHGGTCYGLSEFKVDCAAVTVSSNDEELSQNVTISVSPNPFAGIATVDIGNLTLAKDSYYQIYNSQGQMIKQNSITDTTFRLDLSNMPSGAYRLLVYSSNQKQSILINHINQ